MTQNDNNTETESMKENDNYRLGLSQYQLAAIDILTALLCETHETETNTNIVKAAFNTPRIPDEMIHQARQEYDNQTESDNNNPEEWN